jgi:hypothetical protein
MSRLKGLRRVGGSPTPETLEIAEAQALMERVA